MNYTTNNMTITASDDILDDIMKTCFRPTHCEDGLARPPSYRLDFETVRPIAPDLAFVEGTTWDSRIACFKRMLAAEAWRLQWDDTARNLLDEYERGLSNDLSTVLTYLQWGTFEPGFDFMIVRLEGALIVRFTNCGNPPFGIFSELGKKYPKASIRIVAADHPKSFKGEFSIVDGELSGTRWAIEDDRNGK
jgi:hypothetical protein